MKGLSQRFGDLIRKWRSVSVPTSLFPALSDRRLPETIKRSSERPVSPPELVPGNYHSFDFFIEIRIAGTTHLGYPKRALRDTRTISPVTVWGTPLDLSWPNPKIPRVPWIDDLQKGLTGTMTSPEELLGVEGMLGDVRYRFEKILDAGENQVVYSLICDQNQTRIAYGFSRELFKAVGSID